MSQTQLTYSIEGEQVKMVVGHVEWTVSFDEAEKLARDIKQMVSQARLANIRIANNTLVSS